MENSDNLLIPFLRELANSVESKQLEPDQLKCVGEFYMSYKFNDQKNGRDNNFDNDLEETDIIKFLTLGWYFYTHIQKNSITGPVNPDVNDLE